MDEPKTQPIHPTRVLVVDDHPNTATTLARGIAQLGSKVEVFSATSGHEALDRFKDSGIDILITDMIMPEMTGLELIEKLQNHPARRPAFSYLVTAYDVPGLKVTARRLKVKDVIIKPIHPERICKIVLKAIDEMSHVKPAVAETVKAQPFTILIADDQPDNLMLLSRYLDAEGYSYIKAKDGVETLEKTRNHLPDLILLDINMPNKDGFAVLEEIRSDPEIEHIPVIILTAARLDPAEIQSGLNMGADDYVTKPFDRRELLARIRTKLRVKQAEDVIRRRNRELNLLPEIGKELSARLNIDELSDLVLRRTVETMGAMVGHIILLNNKIPLHKEYHISSDSSAANIQIPPLNKLIDQIKEKRESVLIRDTRNDPKWQSSADDPVRSAVIVPMFGRLDLIGLLVFVHEQADYFKVEHQLLLQAIAGQASIAIENARLYTIMAQEQHKLSAILQSAADPIIMFNADGSLSMLNSAAAGLFANEEARIGLPLPRGRGYDLLIEMLEEANETGKVSSKEIPWTDNRIFNSLFTPITEGGCVAVLHDVTHFKQLEKVKNEFIATASHDLRNPLTSIRGYSQLIQVMGPLNENQTDFAKRIQRGVEHMTELIQNMLDLAKMDMGAEQKHEILDINSMLVELANEFKPQADEKEQNLILGDLGVGLKIQGDALKISQALRNLIGNAIKYTPKRGTITLSSKKHADRVNIEVRDTGYGIPAADLPNLFKRFYRVRNNGHDEIEGNGLGLAIVKSIVEQHGGQISVESESGKGSCFLIDLPILEKDTAIIH
jgi:signal transduction histidine kinase/DNA-binding response OmpR family regulator